MAGLKLSSESKIGLICCAVAVVACIWQNILHASGTSLVFDSGHYLGTVQLLCQALNANLAKQPFTDWTRLNQYLLLDGPLVPLAGTIVFGLLGKIPQASHWPILVAIEIFFQAVATYCMASLAFQLTRKKSLALTSGMLWALYPSAILSTDSFLGELPATTLTLLTLRFLVASANAERAKNRWIYNIVCPALAAFLGAIVFMSKPALVVCLVCIFASAFFFVASAKRRPALWLTSTALGGFAAISPWLAFTHSSTGHWHATAYRIPIYNITRGMSFDSNGWGTVPLDPTMQSYGENSGSFTCMAQIFQSNPVESIKLALRKPERLLLLPWNDFHHKCLGLRPGAQIFLHQFMTLIAIAAFLSIPITYIRTGSSGRLILLCAPLVVAGHLAYIPFETCSRYGFTAIPFLILTSIGWLNYLVQRKPSRVQVICLTIAAIALVFIFNCSFVSLLEIVFTESIAIVSDSLLKLLLAFSLIVMVIKKALADRLSERRLLHWSIKANGIALAAGLAAITIAHLSYDREERTWKCRLAPGESLTRNVTYKPAGKADWNLLLIDCDGSSKGKHAMDGSTVLLNGKALGESFNPNKLIKTWANLEQMQNQFASVFGKDTEALRQWRAFLIPSEYLKVQNEITITAGTPLTIFGANDTLEAKPPFVPSIDYLSPVKLLYEQENLDGRILTPALRAKPSTCRHSPALSNGDLAAAVGKQTGSYRMYIVCGNKQFWQRDNLKGGNYSEAF